MYARHLRPVTDEQLLAWLRVPVSCPTPEALFAYFRARPEPHFFLDKQATATLRSLICEQFPNLLAHTCKAADAVIRHEFNFLGIEVQYGESIPWNADPVSGREWPLAFYADVPICSGDVGYGDVKHVWELNRHQYLIDVGAAYWLTGKVQYVDAYKRLFTSWMEANPYNRGVNWGNALEPAYRVLSWIWAYYFCAEALTPEFLLLFLKGLYQHARYLRRHLELYTSPYNHLIGEATALLFIGTLFPEFQSAKRWTDLSWQVLDTELDNQLHLDGFTVEQASFYHYATLGFYLLAALLRRLNGQPVRDAIWQRIERAIEFSVHLTQPNGQVPRIGDVDDACPIRLLHRPQWDFREFHAMGAVLFQRSDFKYAAGESLEDALWLLGTEGYEAFAALSAKPPAETSKAFTKSGYYFMRTNWERDASWLCFDCGEQAAGLHPDTTPSAAHGHADALAVLLTAMGEPMLVDAGFYTYNAEPSWRDYFHQTRAHNTVVVDGENQSLHLGNMAWSWAARVTCEEWITTPAFDYVCGRHDGYRRLPSTVIHRRAVFFRKPTYWLIFDALQGEGTHSVESYLHLAPSKIKHQKDRYVVQFTSGRRLYLATAGIPLVTDVIEHSDTDWPDSGWIGTSYGCRMPAPVIRWHIEIALPIQWCTLVTLDAEALQLAYHNGVVTVRGKDFKDQYVWKSSAHKTNVLHGDKPLLHTLEHCRRNKIEI